MTDTNAARGNRMILLLIGGIPVTMILTATWLWFFVARGDLDLVDMLGTANRGTLVQPPRQLNELVLRDEMGTAVAVSELEPRWAMVIPATGGRCDESCEKALYVTRQIHVAMGKEFNRLRRLYISDHSVHDTQLSVSTLSDGRPAPVATAFADHLSAEHKDLQSLVVSKEDYAKLFPERGADASTWYLLDPAGWIMMSYNDQVPYKDVISDLKFLLKNYGG
jgi:hypothetical protein